MSALREFLAENPGASIEDVRDFSIDLMKAAGDLYGNACSQAALELQDEIALEFGLSMPDLGNWWYEPDEKSILRTAHYQAQKLVDGDVEGFIKEIGDAARYYAERGANSTMAQTARKQASSKKRKGQRSGAETHGVAFARVPMGPTTCDFCLMLASRGFVYLSKESAGEFDRYHRHCDCRIIPGAPGTDVEGYDPDAYYDMWKHPEKYENVQDQKQLAFEFTPANDVKEAKQYAKSNFDCEADFTGLDIRAVNEMNKSIATHIDMFPELKNNFSFVGSAQACNTLRKSVWEDYYYNKNFDTYERLGKDEDFKRRQAKKAAARTVGKSHGEWAWSYSPEEWYPDSHLGGICMNKSMWAPKAFDQQIESLKYNVETEYHPIGCDTVKSIFDHEIGHQLDSLLSIRSDSEFIAYYGGLSRDEVKSGLSGYAVSNDAEFIAEAWSEYQNNPNPRAHAQFVGDLIMRKYKGGDWR